MIVNSGRARLSEAHVAEAVQAASTMAATSRGEPGALLGAVDGPAEFTRFEVSSSAPLFG